MYPHHGTTTVEIPSRLPARRRERRNAAASKPTRCCVSIIPALTRRRSGGPAGFRIVAGAPEAQHEYDAHAGPLARRSREGGDAEGLARYLPRVDGPLGKPGSALESRCTGDRLVRPAAMRTRGDARRFREGRMGQAIWLLPPDSRLIPPRRECARDWARDDASPRNWTPNGPRGAAGESLAQKKGPHLQPFH